MSQPVPIKEGFCHDPAGADCRFLDIAKTVLTTDNLQIPYGSKWLTVLTPTQIKEVIFGDKLDGPIRNVVEPVSADEQCTRAGIPFKPGQLCWLCGCPILASDSKACEHIFPALRAIMFNGIITTGKIRNRFDKAGVNDALLRRVTAANYDWAHENCNGSGAKGGMVLFKFDEGSQLFVVDRDKCNELQTKIKNLTNPKREDCYKKQKSRNPLLTIYKNLESVITERLVPVNDEFKFFKKFVPNENDTVHYYAKYTEELIKLYASQDALTLLLTEAEKAEKEAKTVRLLQQQQAEARRLLQQQEAEAERLLQQQLDQQLKYEESLNLYLTSQKRYIALSQKGVLKRDYLNEVVHSVFDQIRNKYFSRMFVDDLMKNIIIDDLINKFLSLQQAFDPTVYSTGFMIEVLNVFFYVSMNYMNYTQNFANNFDQATYEKDLINALINFKEKCVSYGTNYTDEIQKIFTIYGNSWYTNKIAEATMAYNPAIGFANVTSDDSTGFDRETLQLLEQLNAYIEENSHSPELQASVKAAKLQYDTILEQHSVEKGGSRYIYKKSEETKAKKKSCKKKRKTRRKRKSTISHF